MVDKDKQGSLLEWIQNIFKECVKSDKEMEACLVNAEIETIEDRLEVAWHIIVREER